MKRPRLGKKEKEEKKKGKKNCRKEMQVRCGVLGLNAGAGPVCYPDQWPALEVFTNLPAQTLINGVPQFPKNEYATAEKRK